MPVAAKYEKACENDIGLELLAGILDHGADAMLGAQKLGHEHADQRLPHCKPQPAKDERHRTGQRDGAKDLQIARAEAASDAQQMLIEAADCRCSC